MITVDASEIKEEINSISDFLKLRTAMSIDIKGGKLLLHLEDKTVSGRDVKTYVKRFLHRRGLSKIYRVTEDKDTLRISKRKDARRHQTERRGTGPSSYQTVPYYFPNHP
jgi:hypothetical protein